MKVFRIEHQDDGQGPYCFNGKSPNLAFDPDRQPLPANDGLENHAGLVWPPAHRFGFVNVKALKAWFDASDRLTLKDHGYVCRVYEVDQEHVRKGKKQVIFGSTQARIRRQCQVFGVKR